VNGLTSGNGIASPLICRRSGSSSPGSRLRSLPRTFETKRNAKRTLSVVETQLVQDDWTARSRGTVKLGDYAQRGSWRGLACGRLWISSSRGWPHRSIEPGVEARRISDDATYMKG
jgi:hypothetical protein